MDDEQRKRRIATLLKWLGGIGVLALLSPVIFFALKGALGLGALAVVAAFGFTTIRLTPVFSMKLSNLVVKLMLSEAKANPIETMVNMLGAKSDELADADAAIVDFETEVMNYDERTADFAKQYPEEASSYEQISAKMREALNQQKQEQAAARQALEELTLSIDKARALYDMSLAAQKVTALSGSARTKVFDEIRGKVAFEAVRSNLNRSFAQLGVALARRKQISVSTSNKTLSEKTT
jgi:hypothetical protein